MTTMAEQEEKEEMLTPMDVAEKLKVPPRTIADLIRAGEIPSAKIGRYRRVHPQDLKEYIQRKRQESQEG